MDSLTSEARSALMKSVKRSNTKPEVTLRKELHRRGFRYVIGDRRLPGTPDLVFPRYKAAVFVHGCFWHGHDCRQGQTPRSNADFWRNKVLGNRARDSRKEEALRALRWRVLTVWECDLKATRRQATVDALAADLRDESNIAGR
jgi:DNA mismatch endonuclease (patch repair protein)